MPKESNLEFKVGLFVLVGMVALTAFIFSITDKAVLEEGKSIRAVFQFANGLKKNAPVRIAGVEEGIVKNIGLFFDRQDKLTKAEVNMWVKRSTKIPADSTITINQLGLLGEKYIEIIPGVDAKEFMEEGKTYVGKDPIAQEAISERVMEVASQVELAISGINEMVRDEEYRQDIGETLANLNSLTGNIDDILSDVKSGKGTVGKLFYDDRLYDDLQGFTSDLKANPWKLLYRPRK
ncbi:MAG TPA: MlaD family protein [Candidatus Omnitrophota bacterium]|nr:MlaD family protein [Candidatus Omnitrophota bacterium]